MVCIFPEFHDPRVHITCICGVQYLKLAAEWARARYIPAEPAAGQILSASWQLPQQLWRPQPVPWPWQLPQQLAWSPPGPWLWKLPQRLQQHQLLPEPWQRPQSPSWHPPAGTPAQKFSTQLQCRFDRVSTLTDAFVTALTIPS